MSFVVLLTTPLSRLSVRPPYTALLVAFEGLDRPCRRVETIRTSATMQTINPGTVDFAAEEGRDAALLAARLYHGARLGLQAISELGVSMAAISRLGPPSRRRNHKIGEEAIDGVSEEPTEIPPATTPRGAAG